VYWNIKHIQSLSAIFTGLKPVARSDTLDPMALFEYHCQACTRRFEAITSFENSNEITCPHCANPSPKKLISVFKVAGRGDLRESTLHGCHDCDVTGPASDTGHDHSEHDHD